MLNAETGSGKVSLQIRETFIKALLGSTTNGQQQGTFKLDHFELFYYKKQTDMYYFCLCLLS